MKSVPKVVVAFFRKEPEARFLFQDWSGPEMVVNYCYDKPTLFDELSDSDVLIIPGNRYTPEIRDAVDKSSVSWIQSTGVGVDAYLEHGVPDGVILSNARGVYTPTLVEHTMALMLGFARGVFRMERSRIRREWSHVQLLEQLSTLRDKHLVVYGMGEIGTAVAKASVAFGMQVHGVTSTGPTRATDAGFSSDIAGSPAVQDSLSKCDYLVLAVPLTNETRHMVDATFYERLSPKCLLINISRGQVLHEPALIAALEDGLILGACLDVFEEEPLPSGSPLWQLENVILSPHVGGLGENKELLALKELVQGNLMRVCENQRPDNCIDLKHNY